MRTGMVGAVVSTAAVVLSLVALTPQAASRGRSEEIMERSLRQKRSEMSGSRWSRWFNSDRPWNGQGDFETTESIGKFQQICGSEEVVVGAQCRVAGSNDTFDSTTTAFVKNLLFQACSSQGLVCLNSQQTSGLCNDYEVRFLCQDTSSDDDNSGGSLFPTFDFKIYIVLAVVPLFVVSLRILWSCCCKQRFKRSTLQRRLQQDRRNRDSSTLSTSSSQTSFDSALASPPPAYADLFGTTAVGTGSGGVGVGGVFSISGRCGGQCLRCGKCVMHSGTSGGDGVAPVPPHLHPHPHHGVGGGDSHVVFTLQELEVVDDPPTSSSSSPSSSSAAVEDNDEVFTSTAPSSSSSSSSSTESSGVTTSRGTDSEAPAQPSADGVVLTRSASGISFLAAVGLPVTSLSPPPPLSSSSSTTPCACACHRGQSGHWNLSFQWEASDPAAMDTPVVHPGMHKPALGFSRIQSVTSFTSFTSLTEPPDYDEALEILKKGGLILDQEKAAV